MWNEQLKKGDISMKVAIIGAGNMGGAIARGLAKGTKVRACDMAVSNPSRGKLEAIQAEFPEITVTDDNRAVVDGADIIVLAVKPWKVKDVIGEVKDRLDYTRQSVVSVAAGIGTAQLCEWLDKGDGLHPAVYYVIPNTAIAVMHSMTFIASAHSTPERDAQMLDVFKELGDAMQVEERLMPACMALASCGIAYVMRYIRAATEGGVELGLYARDAQRIVQQTMRGAVELLAHNGSHPEVEIDKVTTPGGLTIRGLNAMEEAGFTQSVIKGLRNSVVNS